MAIVQGTQKKEFHPTQRRKVLASALVDLRQVQVIDKSGQIRGVIVWQCGPDILVAETMDGLFDSERRFSAPRWLVEQLEALPPSRQFDSRGNTLGSSSEAPPALEVQKTGKAPDGFGEVDDDDDDLGIDPA